MLNIGVFFVSLHTLMYGNLCPSTKISFQEAFILLVAHVIEDVHFNEDSKSLLVILQYKYYYRQK